MEHSSEREIWEWGWESGWVKREYIYFRRLLQNRKKSFVFRQWRGKRPARGREGNDGFAYRGIFRNILGIVLYGTVEYFGGVSEKPLVARSAGKRSMPWWETAKPFFHGGPGGAVSARTPFTNMLHIGIPHGRVGGVGRWNSVYV